MQLTTRGHGWSIEGSVGRIQMRRGGGQAHVKVGGYPLTALEGRALSPRPSNVRSPQVHHPVADLPVCVDWSGSYLVLLSTGTRRTASAARVAIQPRCLLRDLWRVAQVPCLFGIANTV